MQKPHYSPQRKPQDSRNKVKVIMMTRFRSLDVHMMSHWLLLIVLLISTCCAMIFSTLSSTSLWSTGLLGMAHQTLGTSRLTLPSLPFPPGSWASSPPKWCGSPSLCTGARFPPFFCWAFFMWRLFTACSSLLFPLHPDSQFSQWMHCHNSWTCRTASCLPSLLLLGPPLASGSKNRERIKP